MVSEQIYEQELREAARAAIGQVTASFAYEGQNRTIYDRKAQMALTLMGRHNTFYSGRNNRAMMLLKAAKLVGASGPALIAVIQEVAPQVPLLAADDR